MKEVIDYHIDISRFKGLVIDTELLILLLIGKYDPEYVSTFKITNKFTKKDFNLVNLIVNHFNNIIITPHIIAELSNHSMKIPTGRIKLYFDHFIKILKKFKEVHIEKDLVFKSEYLPLIGITDYGILLSSKENDYLLFTTDRSLTQISRAQGVNVLNFNEIRYYKLFKN